MAIKGLLVVLFSWSLQDIVESCYLTANKLAHFILPFNAKRKLYYVRGVCDTGMTNKCQCDRVGQVLA